MTISDAHGRDDGARSQPALESTSTLEWIIAAAGGVLLVAALAYMVVFAVTTPQRPPAVTLSVTSVTTTPGGYLVSFRAKNAGGETAAGVQVSGELRRGDTVVETRDMTIDYLPQRSERRGGLFFSSNPVDHQLSLHAHGYAKP